MKKLLLAVLLCLAADLPAIRGQQPVESKPPAQTEDEVLRINTELVQTDLTVLDRQGRFVDDLRPEQIQLSVNGRPQAISFFERVSTDPGADARAAGKDVGGGGAKDAPTASTTHAQARGRGRVIFFFVDDMHLAGENLARARRALLRFVNDEMGQDDRAAIISTSGSVGFLQQLTDNKAVLREAATRLGDRRITEAYAGKVQISEADAAQVSEHFNRELFNYLVAATAAEFQSDEVTAANMVRNRVHQINQNARAATAATLAQLERLIQSSSPLPGRKLIFFISDGFVADPRVSNVSERLREITKGAARVGAVIYTMDARGTFSDPSVDASKNPYPDFTGVVSRNLFGETEATQEPLHRLAQETGGRAFLNSNSFEDAVQRAIAESSSYYLLAWRPESEAERNAKARLSVSIKNRPDLKVRLRRGFLEAPAAPSLKRRSSTATTISPAQPIADAELRAALGSLYPLRALPVALSVGYLNARPHGTTLMISMQLDSADLTLVDAGTGAQRAEVDVLGVALDDRGALSSFKQKLMVVPEPASSSRRRLVVWNQQLRLPPGLYQVRVAVRERASGRAGSAIEWLEIPDPASGRFRLGSIFVGENQSGASAAKQETPPEKSVPVNVERRFARTSRLRFQTYIYNAPRAAASGSEPDVTVQAQIFRGRQLVVSLPPAKPPRGGPADPLRLAYSGEVPLGELSAGRYVLRVTATDLVTGKTAAEQIDFAVE